MKQSRMSVAASKLCLLIGPFFEDSEKVLVNVNLLLERIDKTVLFFLPTSVGERIGAFLTVSNTRLTW